MSKSKGTKQGEVLDTALGAANVAANNAAVEAEAKKRGRPVSDRLTFAKFSAGVKSGIIPDGVKVVPQTMEGNRVIQWMHFETESPVLTLSDEGDLSLANFATERGYNKPHIVPVKTIKYAELIKLLTE